MRIGCGIDVHPLIKGEKLILGGIHIPSEVGAKGHSDADCLTHAIVDALLGAGGLGDIGQHFPPSEEKYRGISSLIFLEEVQNLLDSQGFRISNVDASIALEKPKLASYVSKMCESISIHLAIQKDQVNIKATTFEGLGMIGRGEGVMVYAVALIQPND